MSYTYTDKIKFDYTTNFDAFDRLRVSNPFTLFDSSSRFESSEKWNTYATGGTSSASFNSNQGLVDLTVGPTSGYEVLRETKRVFAYQPGKSLLVLNTFTLNAPKANLRQRVGYFGQSNGFYLELDGSDIYMVERSSVSGVTTNTRISKSNWNVDPMDGNGPSGVNLNLEKSQILWIDLEWLGVGSVRTGFVVNGVLYTAHVFHHSNIITGTYITTASLPLRYEITNTGNTSSQSTLKQICSSTISEGGYELRGDPLSISTPISTPYNMGVSGTYYPLVSIRLKSTRLDGIVIPKGISILPKTTGNYNYRIISGGTTTGGTWVSAGTSSLIEYNITGTSFSGGNVCISGFTSQTNQNSPVVSGIGGDFFKYQLERNSFTGTSQEFTLCLAVDTASGGGNDVYGSLEWEEINR